MTVRSLAGPLVIAAGVWCAAGNITLADTAAPMVRLVAPASLWWFVGALVVAVAVPAWRRSPSFTLPALLPVVPWLPLPLPAAAWLWTGGLSWVPIGLAALAAWCAGWRTGDPGKSGTEDRVSVQSAAVAGLLTTVIGCLVLAAIHPRLPGGDEPHYLIITQSLLQDGDLRIENNHETRDYLAYIDGPLRPDYIQRGQNGEIYSIHAPGVSVLVAPLFWMFGLRGAQATIIALAGLAGAFIWIAGWLAARDRGAAWFAWAAVVGSTTFLLQSVMVFPDGPAAAAVAVALVVWLRMTHGEVVSVSWLVFASGALALLPFLHTRFSALSAGLGAAVLLTVWRNRQIAPPQRIRYLAAFCVLPAIGAVAWLGYFYIIYGTPNPTIPYGADAGGGRLAYVPGGLAGLLFDQQFGLLTYSPVLALAVVGWFRRPPVPERPRFMALALVVVFYLVAVTTYWMWWVGVPATPARLATSILPLLVPSIAIAWVRRGVAFRTGATVLLAVSLAISLWVVAYDRGALAWNDRDAYALWLTHLESVADLVRVWPSFFWRLVGGDVRSQVPYAWHLLVWMLAFAASTLACRGLARSSRSRERQILCGVWWLPLGLTAAALGGWWVTGSQPTRPVMSQVATLRHVANSGQLVTVAPWTLSRVAAGEAPLRLTIPRWDLPDPGPVEWRVLRNVPAGFYDVYLSTRRPAGGTLTASLAGRTGLAQTYSLPRQSVHRMTLDLIDGAAALWFDADDELATGVDRLDIVPRRLRLWAGRPARAVLRGSDVSVLLLDEQAFAEDRAFWVRGSRKAETTFVARDRATRTTSVRLINGPHPNVVTIVTGAATTPLEMAPSETRILTLALDEDGTASLSITSAAGFRPSDDGRSEDTRYLGVRVELD